MLIQSRKAAAVLAQIDAQNPDIHVALLIQTNRTISAAGSRGSSSHYVTTFAMNARSACHLSGTIAEDGKCKGSPPVPDRPERGRHSGANHEHHRIGVAVPVHSDARLPDLARRLVLVNRPYKLPVACGAGLRVTEVSMFKTADRPRLKNQDFLAWPNAAALSK